MWDSLTPADAEQAKNDLALRRAAALHRHAEELQALDNEAAEIETFVRVAEAFAQRFKNRAAPSSSETSGESAAAPTPDAKADEQVPQTGLELQQSPNFASDAKADEAMPLTGLKVQHSTNFAGLVRRYRSS